jgi:formylglycine-generating enzyme required for sulfatase activity
MRKQTRSGMAGTRAEKWWIGLGLAGLALVAVAESWGWVRAWWIYPGLSEEQRVENFNAAFVARPWRGIAARLDRGGMTILARSDIADIGTSRCTRESECTESLIRTRRASIGCPYVSVRFYCAYAIRTTDGNAATAFLKVNSNRNYSPGVTVPGSPGPFEVDGPRFSDANEELCKLGFGCQPATDAHAKSSFRKETQQPSLPPPAKAGCKGIRVEVVGIGEVCLDPGDPTQRDFRDCHNAFCGPAMVALPTGRGLRGSSAADIARLRKDDPRAGPEIFREETPQREITIGYQLAVGKFEVTYDEWDACLSDGGCKRRPEDPRDRERERGALPVVHVSWIEVSDEFLPWLNRKLGLSGASAYRLLTESEWEYAARAGTSTKFAFGDIISTAQANFYGGQSHEVGSIAPNGFGLHDMHGNVPEWVQDCYENGYDNAPVDGSAYDPGNCSSRMHRGGAWNDVPRYIRSAHRGYSDPKDRNWKGFRVARTLVVR